MRFIMHTIRFFIPVTLFVYSFNTISAQDKIRLNQLGFYTHAPKVAIIIAPTETNDFYIIGNEKRDTLYKGILSKEIQSAYSSTKTRVADFSQLQTPGSYTLYVPGIGNSYPFTIKSNAQHELALASLKAFYFMRVSMPLEQPYAGKWARAAGHPDTAVLIHPSAADDKRKAGAIISTPGGWYDAGDYNKYIVNSGITMGTLLSAYEDFSTYFDTLNTNIPESKDRIPDLLNEIIYNLRWMLTMQDPNDGGVYNKCTNAAFDGMVMPGVTKLPRYVVQKGTAATLDFAAVTAQAARILKKFKVQLPGLSDSCLHASAYAWQWALQHPAMAYNQDAINQQYEPKITTGGYGDRYFTDEWFWAASELYATTSNNQYYDTIKVYLNQPFSLPSWSNVQALGYYTLLRSAKEINKNDVALIRTKLLSFADALIENGGNKAFKTIMGQNNRDFNWGSNSNAANQGIALLNAWRISSNKKYIDAALTNLDYIVGRNATGYCFVTGTGNKSTMHPHHRPSVADGITEPVPGLVAGGPNPGMQDKCHYDFTEAETAYSDTDCAYASNEIAINWNAPLVYLANGIEALQYKVAY